MNSTHVYEVFTRIREPLLNEMLDHIGIPPGSNGLDISEAFIDYARQNNTDSQIECNQADVNKLALTENSVDWIWSMDALWAGPAEYGCATEDPSEIIDRLYRILRPGGKIYLAFWSSQKIMPGHPLLEARLNATPSANVPFREDMLPERHFLNAKKWLADTNFKNIQAKTFVGDISPGSNDEEKQDAIVMLQEMLWGKAENETNSDDWARYKALSDPESEECLFNSPHYHGFYTYTLFQGQK